MMWVGLTGGMGSGKSTVATLFEHLGIPVYVADERTKALYHSSRELREGLMALLGPSVYQGHHFQSAVASRVLVERPELWDQLNALVHPAVGADFEAWASQQTSPYVLEESAILFETNLYKRMQATIVVTAPEDIRIQRVIQRSGLSEAEVRSRMARQWPAERVVPLADYVINNDGQHSMIHQVIAIHEALIRRANQAG
jgi:dephospho-CoA kinase